jgi:putative effector of murein hydrolase
MLSPATVALAVPLYTQAAQLRRSAVRLCLAAGLRAAVASTSAVSIAASLGASDAVLRSIAPRSATTAIALTVSERIGGQPGLTAAMVIISGILGAIISGWVLDTAGVHSVRQRGLAMGVSGHAIATARALAVSAETGAFAAIGMAFAGILTGLLLPAIWTALRQN